MKVNGNFNVKQSTFLSIFAPSKTLNSTFALCQINQRLNKEAFFFLPNGIRTALLGLVFHILRLPGRMSVSRK